MDRYVLSLLWRLFRRRRVELSAQGRWEYLLAGLLLYTHSRSRTREVFPLLGCTAWLPRHIASHHLRSRVESKEGGWVDWIWDLEDISRGEGERERTGGRTRRNPNGNGPINISYSCLVHTVVPELIIVWQPGARGWKGKRRAVAEESAGGYSMEWHGAEAVAVLGSSAWNLIRGTSSAGAVYSYHRRNL